MKRPRKDQAAAEPEPATRPRRAARKPSAPEFFIYYMPEGKGGERVKRGSVPVDVDVEEHIEAREDCEPGLYRVEKRIGGEVTREVYWYTKEEDAPALDLPEDEGEGDDLAAPFEPARGHEQSAPYIPLADAQHMATEAARRAVAEALRTQQPTTADGTLLTPQGVLSLRKEIIEEEERRRREISEEVERRMRDLTATQTPARVERAPRIEPTDPVMSAVAELAKSDPTLAARIADSVFPTNEESGTLDRIVRAGMENPQSAMTLIGAVFGQLNNLVNTWRNRNAAPNGNAPAETAQTAPAQAAPPFPPAIQHVLEVIGEDAINFAPDDELEADEPHGGVLRACDACLDATKANPEHGALLNVILSLTPLEIAAFISGRAGLPFPGFEQLRVGGFEYLAKLQTADEYFRELKRALLLRQAGEPETPTPDVANNGHKPAETKAAA